MIQSRLFLLRDINFIHGALSDFKLCRMFSFTYTLHERSFSKIHNEGTLSLIIQMMHYLIKYALICIYFQKRNLNIGQVQNLKVFTEGILDIF